MKALTMNGLKLFLTCVVINIYFRRGIASHGTGQCGSTKTFGDNDIYNFDDITSNSNYAYMMNDGDLVIDCCGVIHRWVVTVENVPAGTTPIYFQVWRPTAAGGNSYELVGQNVETVTSDGWKTFDIATANRITVKNKDRFGWYVNGDDIVTYKAGGGEFDANHMQAMASAPTVGNTVSWGGTIANDRSYAIRVVVDPNTDPVFTNTQWSISVGNAVAIGTSLVKLTVNDDDSNDVSTLVVTMVANTKYSFDTSTYILTTAGSLGADGGTSTKLSFRVADQCGNTGSATFTVTITNDPPVIHSLPNVISVSEDETLETLLHTLNVTDTYGAPTCSLAASVPAEWPFFMQKVPGTSDYGIYSESSPGFNYVVKKSYDIPVECTDGFLSDTETLSVKLIQNTPPVILNLQNSTSVSTTDPIGTTAFYVIATDSTNDDITFSMTCSPVVCPFKIFNSGEIQITEDLSGHTVVGYDLQITVADSRNTVGPRLLTITIADLNDPVQLTNIPSSVVIKENSAVGALVYTVSFSDIDTSQKHTFAMTSSPVQGLSYFSIDPSTGQVTTSGVINYEALTATSFILGVTVTDPVTSDAANLTVTVSNINEAPSFAQSSYSLSASEGLVGTVIGTPPFGLADPDAGDSVTLTLDCGSQTAYFYMHSTSGQISYQSSYDLDSGSLPSAVTCNVSATDTGGVRSFASLFITISDVNDNVPQFSPTAYTFHVDYYASPGAVVGAVTATDEDIGKYGVVTYSLEQSFLDKEYFSIDVNGRISVRISPSSGQLAYASAISVTARASDVDGNEDTSTVLIIVSDTTTTSTTTTTLRYRKFIEDGRNVAWVSASAVIIAAIIVALGYVIYTCEGDQGCSQFSRNLCNKRKSLRRLQPRRMPRSYDFRSRDFSPAGNQESKGSIRHPPPPKQFQWWRSEAL